MRDVLNGVLNSRVNSSGLFSSFDWFKQTQAELNASVTPTNYSYQPGDVRRYGAAGNSTGATGNGIDDWQAFQNAINVSKQSSGPVYVPSPTAGDYYRVGASLDFTGTAVSFSFIGESMLDTAIFADFTSGTRVAFFNLGNSIGTRARVAFSNFRIKGLASLVVSTKVIGMYFEYTSELSRVENVYVHGFEEGVLVANDFYTKFYDLQCVGNFSQGLRLGYKLDGVTLAPSFNNSLFGGDYTNNGGWGVFVFGAQAFSAHGVSCQGNVAGQAIMSSCEGGGWFGKYIEHLDDASTPTAQIYIINCNGFGVYGFPCPAFQHDGSPIVLVEASVGITLNNFRPRTTGGPFTAVGIKNDGSTLTINDSYLSDLSAGLSLAGAGQTTLNNVNFGNCTTSVLGNGSANRLVWNQAIAADVATANLTAANVVDIYYNDNTKNQIENTETFYISVTFTELNAGGKIIIDSILPSERWRIIDILAYIETPFLPAGGDRNVQVLDAVGAIVYTTITAATLKAAASQNKWGSVAVPIPLSADSYTPTSAQHDLRVQYQGGATNYTTAGVLQLTVTAMRTA